MNKLCLDNSSQVSEDSKYEYYVKGYKINYSTASSKSDSSSSDFLEAVSEKSFSPKGTRIKREEKTEHPLTPEEVRQRCRVAYECRNNKICIEGHPIKKK